MVAALLGGLLLTDKDFGADVAAESIVALFVGDVLGIAVVAAIKAGAEDFIEKPVDDAQLLAAINRCLARVFDELSQEQSLADLRRHVERVTPRELEVMDLVVQGFTSSAIADRLGISVRTVESYRMQIMDKMQAASVAMLVRQAIRLGRLYPVELPPDLSEYPP